MALKKLRKGFGFVIYLYSQESAFIEVKMQRQMFKLGFQERAIPFVDRW